MSNIKVKSKMNIKKKHNLFDFEYFIFLEKRLIFVLFKTAGSMAVPSNNSSVGNGITTTLKFEVMEGSIFNCPAPGKHD